MDILKDKPVKLDLEAAIANIKRKGTPNRGYCFEHGLEPGIKQSLCKRFDLCKGLGKTDQHFWLQREIRIPATSHEAGPVKINSVAVGSASHPVLSRQRSIADICRGPIQPVR